MKPPRLADRLLALFCAPHLLEAVQGDLHEEFAFQVERLGERRARWWYWREVLGFLKPFALKRKPNEFNQSFSLHPDMLRNYFKIAWRNLWKQRTHTVVNVVGLAVGLAVCLLIAAYVVYERSYDRFNRHYSTLYRVVQHQNQNGTWYEVGRTPGKLAAALNAEFPEVKAATRFSLGSGALLTYRNTTADEPNRLLAEPSLFELFTFPFVQGDPKQALESPNSIVLTQRLARKYFAAANPMGQLVRMDGKTPMRVTGVLKDIPANSHLQFDFVIPLAYLKTTGEDIDNWNRNRFYTYVQLHNPAQQAAVDAKLRPYAEATFGNKDEQFYLQPLASIHLHSRFDFNSDFGKRGDIRYVRFFTVLAMLVLLLGCLNFINLSTARALTRANEVGVRKAIGARRRQLVAQFLGESVLVVGLAGTMAVLLVQVGLPLLSDFVEKPLNLPFAEPVFWLLMVGIVVVTSLVAGSYPALVLSSFRPVRVLRGQNRGGASGSTLRQVLVVGQFTLAVVMMAAVGLIYRQLHYVSTRKLGLQKDNIVYVELKGDLRKNLSVAKAELLRLPGVEAVTATNFYSMPFKWVGSSGTGGIEVGGQRVAESFNLHDFQTDYGFIETMGITLAQGRSFSPSFGRDTTNFILNEAAVRRFGLKKPVGTSLNLYGRNGLIVGVVRDFHFATLKEKVEPALLRLDPANVSYLLVRIAPHHISRTVAAVRATANQLSGGHPVEAHFLGQAYDQLYQQEQTAATLLGWFTSLAILVSCLGLFGLAAFTAEQRTKEIGVRKVLGASVVSLVALLSKDILKLVLIAIVIAIPLTWYAMSRWLENFAYKVNIGWEVFALAGLLAVGIALLTVSFQSVKAALMNPVKSLRTE